MTLPVLPPLRVYTDGASRDNPGAAAIGYVVCDAADDVLDESLLGFPNPAGATLGIASNNEAEYRAFLTVTTLLLDKFILSEVAFFSDSELMIRQLSGVYKVKSAHLQVLHRDAQALLGKIPCKTLTSVPRSHPLIRRCDALANAALDGAR